MPISLRGEKRLSNLFNSSEQQNSGNLIVEKENLLCVFKLVVKDLLNTSLDRERLLDRETFPLKHFLSVFEHILFHGYNGKKSFSINTASNRKDLWPVIELISRKTTDDHITEIQQSLKEMNNLRTSLGRVRAWLRLALMQKRLADYFKTLIEQRQELTELYENDAILLSDQSILIPGLLLGLNVLDFNLYVKELVLDIPIEPAVHYSLYLRERRIPTDKHHPPGALEDVNDLEFEDELASTNEDPVGQERISTKENEPEHSNEQRLSNVLDQKHYLEELNNNLQRTLKALQDRVQNLEQTNKTILDNLTNEKIRHEQSQSELKQLLLEKEQLQLAFQRKIDTLNSDISAERETFQCSRDGFDVIYTELQKKYEEEKQAKQKLENVYQTQVSQNEEHVQAKRTMEKSMEMKATLLEQLKEENNQLMEKVKTETSKAAEQEQNVRTMEKKNQMLRDTVSGLETNLAQISQEAQKLSSANDALSRVVLKSDAEKTSLETDLRVEQDFHQRLQAALNKEKEKVSELQFDLHELTLLKQEYESYKRERGKKESEYEKRFREQEKTIQDLALKLEASITREDEFREKDGLRSSIWMKDVKAKDCCQCQKEFTPLRRKHHCRSCGQIFCESCASTKMPLASSHKPVRVCDCCRDRVLAQCAVNSS